MEAEYLSVGVGEDAYFKRDDALGVADGVGGWGRVQGSNAAMYSRKLMHYAAVEIGRYDEIHDQHDMDAFKAVDPKEVLKRAYDDLNGDKEKENILGSTTALIALLRTDRLRIANLGDCGLIVLRDQDIYFRTEEQQHSFNFPYQLGTGSRDVPDDAEKCDIDVQEGDIVVVGSDGLFDNLFDDDIVEIVRSCTDDVGIRPVDADPQEIADALVERTRQIQEDPSSVTTPFQVKAVDEGLYHEGGKQDDTTCVVGIVKLDQDSPDRR
ncbi:protein serine/threonine phosphatase 2C [Gonapodya prolifera JEL478]|uniref:Protein phosphatase n=1 Tax=Gonapodya prolifera (strain JEL478) TaxID=1344416 RepID=A0A139AET1_GONPJ|nr:protein serine/threonine phosphatase 2C [Gonapodya prolifera JEL478]|eukprot:KXS15311.1 protein serine/threonine phosphatase 2C [Gonapodya prolifera JEL478]